MKERKFSQQNKEFMNQLNTYDSIFQHFFVPDRETLIEEKKRQYCMELMKKSCEEGYDYVAEYYNIDVEHRKKHFDVIYD